MVKHKLTQAHAREISYFSSAYYNRDLGNITSRYYYTKGYHKDYIKLQFYYY